MLAPLLNALTHRMAGPAGAALSVLLAILLATSLTLGSDKRAHLESEVVRLNRQLDAAGLYWQAQLASCQTTGPAPAAAPDLPGRSRAPNVETVAQRLVREPPAGFDVCARMESADQAVLDSLK